MRINLINPRYLTDQHLIAEYREILMATKLLERTQNSLSPIPSKFSLKKGHIVFFRNKVLYLKKRHQQLIDEMTRRGFRAKHKIHSEVFPKKFLHDWKPGFEDRKLVGARIIDRLGKRPKWYRYYSRQLPFKDCADLIIKGVSDEK